MKNNNTIEISKNHNDNYNFLGYDENDEGDFNFYFMCPQCKENNYIIQGDYKCELCATLILWTD